MNKIKILLVEDEPEYAALLPILLAKASNRFEVVHTDRVENSVELLLNQKFSLVLLDLGLPDSQRTETVPRIFQAAAAVPIVVLTGDDNDDSALQALKEGAQDYLVKGQLTSELLLRSICYAIERQRAQAQRRQIKELKQALGGDGPIAVCSSCKRIQDDDGWTPFEAYLTQRLGAAAVATICPGCSD